jgi:hypothetical protein
MEILERKGAMERGEAGDAMPEAERCTTGQPNVRCFAINM